MTGAAADRSLHHRSLRIEGRGLTGVERLQSGVVLVEEGRPDVGGIAAGRSADFEVLNDQCEVRAVVAAGEPIDPHFLERWA